MPQGPTKNFNVPPVSFRENMYVSTDNLGASFKNDSEHTERDELELPSNPTVIPHSLSDSVVQTGHKEHFCQSRNSLKTIPHMRTTLESSLHGLAISGPSTVQTPADSQDTEENIHEYELIDQHSPSLSRCKVDFGLPANSQKESLMLTHTESKKSTQKHIQVQGIKPSDVAEGRVLKQRNLELPTTAKMESTYIEMFGTSRATVNDDSSEYCEVRQSHKLSLVATTRSGVFVGHSNVHRNGWLNDREAKAHRSMDTDHTVALTGERTCSEARPELLRIDSTTSKVLHSYIVNNPTKKGDSHIYAYDYLHHSFVQICKRRRRCTGVPPRGIRRIGYEPLIYETINPIKGHKTYVNFRFTENNTISLPPRKNHKTPTAKQRTIHKSSMPPRNIPRPGCYLSAPSAVPKY